MMLVAAGAIPRGGTLTVDPVEGSPGFRITAAGLNARVTPTTVELLVGSLGQTVDAHGVQPFYTGILARECGLSVSAVAEAETVVVAAR
jgi:histidine phosphotransferase ChpT